jgi:MYXO-CTERM domain-containing protein
MGVLGDGSVLAGVFEGLAVTHDRGCNWAFAGAPLASEYVIDVSVQKDDPSRGVAITSTGIGSGGFHVMVAETSDNGATWAQMGTAIMSDFLALTIDVAPSDPSRVYASGIVGKTFAPAIERSDDRGKTWTRYYLDPVWAKDVPFIAAIDPKNADRVYLRLSGADVDRLLLSEDGAMTFTEKYTATDDLLGFALSPDGTRVAIGGPKDGLLIASTTDLAFAKQSELYTRCLTWTPAGLYACANQFVDTFTVGISQDEGKTFTNIYDLPDICPVTCPDGSATPPACTSTWPGIAATLGIDLASCGGVGGGGTSSSASSSGAGGGTSGATGGCSCSVDGAANGWGAAAFAAITAMGAFLRHRRRRRG